MRDALTGTASRWSKGSLFNSQYLPDFFSYRHFFRRKYKMPALATLIRRSALPVLAVFLGSLLISRFREDRKYVLAMKDRVLSKGGGFDGLDIDGTPLELSHQNANRFVFIVLHTGKASGEIQYWEQVESLLPSKSRLIGVCETIECVAEVKRYGAAKFPIVEYAGYLALDALWRQYQAGRVPICGSQGEVLASVPWELNSIASTSLLRGIHDSYR
jgi:hypothetical protein